MNLYQTKNTNSFIFLKKKPFKLGEKFKLCLKKLLQISGLEMWVQSEFSIKGKTY
jgi:hypothetical protein